MVQKGHRNQITQDGLLRITLLVKIRENLIRHKPPTHISISRFRRKIILGKYNISKENGKASW
jgi:hypothetical protein